MLLSDAFYRPMSLRGHLFLNIFDISAVIHISDKYSYFSIPHSFL